MTSHSQPLADLRKKYPWPQECPEERPIDWSLDGGGRHLITDLIRREHVTLLFEIGAFLGGSIRQWLEFKPDLIVIALDPWEGTWGNFARALGKSAEIAEQLDRPESGYRTFLSNLWEYRDRVIPMRGRSPEKLHELVELGVTPQLVYLDSDKSGDEIDLCSELFPKAIMTGDDWGFSQDGEKFPIRRPVKEHCQREHRYLRTKMCTWVIDRRPPSIKYRVRSFLRTIQGRAS